MSSARDFSVMPVQVWNGDGTPAEAKPLERAVRRKGHSLNVGSFCDVEFGATWKYFGTVAKERVDGQWRQCQVVRHEGAIVHVRLSPAMKVETPPAVLCECSEGWVCEDHPDQPLGHGCGGAGKRCLNAECPWWKGPKPAAMDLTSEIKIPS